MFARRLVKHTRPMIQMDPVAFYPTVIKGNCVRSATTINHKKSRSRKFSKKKKKKRTAAHIEEEERKRDQERRSGEGEKRRGGDVERTGE